MAQSIEYRQLMTETVFINLPGPSEPDPGMSGEELLHGFLAELHRAPTQQARDWLETVCGKWDVRYRTRGAWGP